MPGAMVTASLTVAAPLRVRGRAGARLLPEQGLQLTLELRLRGSVRGEVARHQGCLRGRVVGDDLTVEREDLLLNGPGRGWRRGGTGARRRRGTRRRWRRRGCGRAGRRIAQPRDRLVRV